MGMIVCSSIPVNIIPHRGYYYYIPYKVFLSYIPYRVYNLSGNLLSSLRLNMLFGMTTPSSFLPSPKL